VRVPTKCRRAPWAPAAASNGIAGRTGALGAQAPAANLSPAANLAAGDQGMVAAFDDLQA
jgi:hypothetical protein